MHGISMLRELTVDDLEHLIQQKVLELLRNRDAGLKLKPEVVLLALSLRAQRTRQFPVRTGC